MKKIKSINSKESEIQECINSAYADLQILLQGAFINVSKLPNQLSIIEFNSLFENYDWNNIFNTFEQIEGFVVRERERGCRGWHIKLAPR